MPNIPANYQIDLPTTNDVLFIEAPLTSAIITPIVNGFAWLSGYVSQYGLSAVKEVKESGTGTHGPLSLSLKGEDVTDYIMFRVSNNATYLDIMLLAQVLDNEDTNKIEVWCALTDGTIIDGTPLAPAILWEYDRLPVNAITIRSKKIAVPTWINTKSVTSSAETRRCLNISSAQGQDLIIFVRQVGCKILSFNAQELYVG